jgi:quercetin dioxygenase-like cupin family protein
MLIALIISASVPAQGTSASAEQPKNATLGNPNRIVQILQEPRHRLVHRDGDIYVLDVQINPGDMTLQHAHDAAILYNFISSGTGPSGGRVSSNTDYATKHFTHQVSNEGPGLFRIIAMTHYGPPLADLKTDRPTGMSGEPEMENPWFRAYVMTLAPGQGTELQRHYNPSIIVQVTEGLVHVSREDGITSELTSARCQCHFSHAHRPPVDDLNLLRQIERAQRHLGDPLAFGGRHRLPEGVTGNKCGKQRESSEDQRRRGP